MRLWRSEPVRRRAIIAPLAFACCLFLSAGPAAVSQAANGGFKPAVRLASLPDDKDIETNDEATRALVFGGDVAPSPAMKSGARGFPVVDRRLKGDPLTALRPGLSGLQPWTPSSARARRLRVQLW
ncbi:MAG: hypothetical protein BGP06_01830 [Rhizobiales bacterium 65-9]|nr:hypothetical protein [Hyphomicrobiales bacterium]OJY38765.1 MAG: hypothetical protein BGP06_01830 [Rhizobiales bacterium 65-9]